MRMKILLILGLLSAVFVSSTVGTLSNYTTASSFGMSIQADSTKIRQKSSLQVQEQDSSVPNEHDAKQAEPDVKQDGAEFEGMPESKSEEKTEVKSEEKSVEKAEAENKPEDETATDLHDTSHEKSSQLISQTPDASDTPENPSNPSQASKAD